MEPRVGLRDSSDCASRLPRKEPTGWRGDCMPWCSIWKGEQPPKLPVSSKCIDPRFVSGWTIGSNGEWKEFWRDTAPVAPKNSPMRSCRLWGTFWTAARLLTDSIPGFGPARWSPELLRRNSRFPTILPMSPGSFTNWSSPSSVRGRSWPVRTNKPNLGGCGIAIRTLKKSQERRGRPALRRRGHFPAGPHSLSNLGQGRVPAGDSYDRAKEVFKGLWHDRTLCRPFSLPFSKNLQCFDLYQLPGEAPSKLLSPENLSDPGQRFLSQGRRGLGLVFWTSKEYRGFQSANLLTSPECLRKSLALYPDGGHAQSLLRDSRGTIFILNFDFPQYPTSSISGPRFAISFSIICHVALFMQGHIFAIK
jgi:hypothetical protein